MKADNIIIFLGFFYTIFNKLLIWNLEKYITLNENIIKSVII